MDSDNRTPGRNDPCPCGSGKRFKKCCGNDSEGGNVAQVGARKPNSPTQKSVREKLKLPDE
jgi:hypothetical protein